MEKIKNLSLRKTVVLYLTVSLVCSFLLSALVVETASRAQEAVWWKYVDKNQYFEAVEGEKEEIPYYRAEVPRPYSSDMSKTDLGLSEFCDFLQTYTVLILSVAASLVSVILFYRNKLKTPLGELERASARIAAKDLDFCVIYENQDEMGRLCREFERMRQHLLQNNRELWKMIEEERALRAAIAHDIRSPLSVLRGYQEMLMEFGGDKTIDTEEAKEMLAECMKQVERMDTFVETMRQLNSLEQRELKVSLLTASQLKEDIKTELAILAKESKKESVLYVNDTSEVFWGDKEVILEVTENLLSNALRYAKERIEVTVFLSEQELKICVKDDGDGFGKDTGNITKAFHQQNIKDSLNHAGMGMYISRLYCEKHGGSLIFENQETGGAAVTAAFRTTASNT